jgi:hypothetical protein
MELGGRGCTTNTLLHLLRDPNRIHDNEPCWFEEPPPHLLQQANGIHENAQFWLEEPLGTSEWNSCNRAVLD